MKHFLGYAAYDNGTKQLPVISRHIVAPSYEYAYRLWVQECSVQGWYEFGVVEYSGDVK